MVATEDVGRLGASSSEKREEKHEKETDLRPIHLLDNDRKRPMRESEAKGGT